MDGKGSPLFQMLSNAVSPLRESLISTLSDLAWRMALVTASWAILYSCCTVFSGNEGIVPSARNEQSILNMVLAWAQRRFKAEGRLSSSTFNEVKCRATSLAWFMASVKRE